jgi:hypothetical protein
MPRVCAFIRSEIAKPAASSLALLTRRPEDKRLMAVDRELAEVARLRWAFSELALVLIEDMRSSFKAE